MSVMPSAWRRDQKCTERMSKSILAQMYWVEIMHEKAVAVAQVHVLKCTRG